MDAHSPDRTPHSESRATSRVRGTAIRWRERMAALKVILQLARTNTRRRWRLLLLVEAGMLAAVVLLCTVPLFSALIANVQLQTALNAQGPAGRNVEIVAGSNVTSRSVAQAEDAIVRPIGQQLLAAYTEPQVTDYLVSGQLQLSAINQDELIRSGAPLPRVTLLAYDSATTRSHMRLLAGAFPDSRVLNVPEALVTQQMADSLGLHLGDVLTVGGASSAMQGKVRVVGIWEPARATENFWNGRSFVTAPNSDEQQPREFTVVLDRTAFLLALNGAAQNGMEQHWVYYSVPGHITSANMMRVASRLAQLRRGLAITLPPAVSNIANIRVQVITGIDQVIPAVTQQLAVLALPLAVLTAQVEGLALLFAGMMTSLLIEVQTSEIATLRSRGASGAQLLGGFALQGVALAAVAVALGPWLAALVAAALVSWLIPAATLAAAGANWTYLTMVANPHDVLAQAALGGTLGIGALLLAARRSLRQDILSFRREQGRASYRPFWWRYHLDIALAVICSLAYVDLSLFGGLGVRDRLGQSGNSLLLAAAPALLLLSGALLVMRAFPPLASLAARLARRTRGAAGMLAFAHVSRRAAGPMRAALLLALGVGMGLFALTFSASLGHNAVEHAAYQAGADVRVLEASPLTGGDATRAQGALIGLPGVGGVTPVYRGIATTTAAQGDKVVGLLGGSALGTALAVATLPYLQFDDAVLGSLSSGMPPATLAFDPASLAWFFASLVVAFLLSLIVMARFAARTGLGAALRLGED